jgi:16S rRNA (adenine1518-N6/adenine1519-N6)-dimethyltransferase
MCSRDMVRAKKSFGQNWLVDESVVEKIIEASDIEHGETVLEIGPGTGVLTQALVEAGAHVIAIEADATLIPALRERFDDSIELIHGDILSWGFQKKDEMRRAGGEQQPKRTKTYGEVVRDEALAGRFFLESPYKLVANIPYNITSDVLRRFLTQEPRPSRMVLMVQKEVADRIVATPPHMSLLSVMCQVYAQCTSMAHVPAEAFHPVPKVDSAVVRLDLRERPIDAEDVIKLAKQGFASRRKQLHGNLKSLPGIDSLQVKDALTGLGLSTWARAQELTVDNWIRLTHILSKKNYKY